MATEKKLEWRFWVGVVATILWLAAGFYFWQHYKHPDDLNGLGGFFLASLPLSRFSG
ncbi:hypothetical protein IMW82_01940 [Rhodanobacter sp. B2A1Ga4]|uniref:hypothetical protein n=1 Tax=Rhodanobacter sp. B2A1Ga4 TaxID=2778647 RepID=UPI001B385422|nr:hypothetical protein [Rhodanobacter sp. B2A1Ga4]MBQ4853442.1 hypothetical protein [Rhodanobacter sp. B2A1Ga4]